VQEEEQEQEGEQEQEKEQEQEQEAWEANPAITSLAAQALGSYY